MNRTVRIGLVAVAASLAVGVASVASADQRPPAPFAKAKLKVAAIVVASDRMQAGSLGELAIEARRGAHCGLTLRGPGKLTGGPYTARATDRYVAWHWTVPAAVRGGRWVAEVGCRASGRQVLRRASLRVDGAPSDAGLLVASDSISSVSRGSLSAVLDGGKGGGGYPDDAAVCAHTGRHDGYCADYDFGYRRANGTWALLSARGFAYRNCTDFAAWKAGVTWAAFKFPRGKGNASDWGDYAANAGLVLTQTPSVGDIAWWRKTASGSSYGHVAIVTAVTGATVTVEEYNGGGRGEYRLRPGVRADGYLHRPGAAAPTPVITPTPNTPAPSVTPAPNTPVPTVTPTPPTTPGPTAPAPPVWQEQQGSLGANTFQNPSNASGMGVKIQPNQWVTVSCKIYAPQIASANPDGYWYRIASPPWNGQYYAVANTFWNGDTPGVKPYTHNTDFAVANC
jgi:surface antigen